MGRTSDADHRLMEAARELIWEESYGAVSVDDICTKADVKKGSFYYFFKSKAELAVAAMEHAWTTEWKLKMDATFSPSVPPLERLRSYLDAVYSTQVDLQKKYGRVLGCPVCSVGNEVINPEHDLNAKIREIFLRKRKYFESAIRDAIAEGVIEPCNPAMKAAAISALIDGIMGEARIMNDPEVAKNLTVMAMALFTLKQPATTPAPAAVTA